VTSHEDFASSNRVDKNIVVLRVCVCLSMCEALYHSSKLEQPEERSMVITLLMCLKKIGTFFFLLFAVSFQPQIAS
jgi:hypothetical protein